MTDRKKEAARNAAWKRDHMTQVAVRFHNVSDADVLAWLDRQHNKADAIRQAIRAQISKEQA